MRHIIPSVQIIATDSDEWLAVAQWIDDDTGLNGEIGTGPGSDPVQLMTGLVEVLRDLAWPWIWWPRQTRHPLLWVPRQIIGPFRHWARSTEWHVRAMRDPLTETQSG